MYTVMSWFSLTSVIVDFCLVNLSEFTSVTSDFVRVPRDLQAFSVNTGDDPRGLLLSVTCISSSMHHSTLLSKQFRLFPVQICAFFYLLEYSTLEPKKFSRVGSTSKKKINNITIGRRRLFKNTRAALRLLKSTPCMAIPERFHCV